jgi:hypothetical protein
MKSGTAGRTSGFLAGNKGPTGSEREQGLKTELKECDMNAREGSSAAAEGEQRRVPFFHSFWTTFSLIIHRSLINLLEHDFQRDRTVHYCKMCHNLWPSSEGVISKYHQCMSCGQ